MSFASFDMSSRIPGSDDESRPKQRKKNKETERSENQKLVEIQNKKHWAHDPDGFNESGLPYVLKTRNNVYRKHKGGKSGKYKKQKTNNKKINNKKRTYRKK
jgi:hypothetical protein